uniref:Uncharacterized protein n=1 Tax=Opuntia streptacantha TaxID=393608 RepID=A0A7C9DUN5_OPUST
MGDMGKESRDFSLGIITRTRGAKLGVRPKCINECTSGVEVLARARSCSLANDAIEKCLSHDIKHRHTTTARSRSRGVARATSTPIPTIGIPKPTIPVLATTQVRGTSTVLGK